MNVDNVQDLATLISQSQNLDVTLAAGDYDAADVSVAITGKPTNSTVTIRGERDNAGNCLTRLSRLQPVSNATLVNGLVRIPYDSSYTNYPTLYVNRARRRVKKTGRRRVCNATACLWNNNYAADFYLNIESGFPGFDGLTLHQSKAGVNLSDYLKVGSVICLFVYFHHLRFEVIAINSNTNRVTVSFQKGLTVVENKVNWDLFLSPQGELNNSEVYVEILNPVGNPFEGEYTFSKDLLGNQYILYFDPSDASPIASVLRHSPLLFEASISAAIHDAVMDEGIGNVTCPIQWV